MANYIGIDFGKSKVGIAIADEETRIAFGYKTVANDRETLNQIKHIAENHEVGTIVVGFPSHSLQDEAARKEKELFAKEVENYLGLPVVFAEEMFTTKIAHTNLKAQGKKKLGKIDDTEAARIILQDYLDAQGL